MKSLLWAFTATLVLTLLGCSQAIPQVGVDGGPSADLAAARRSFKTALLNPGPAPQRFQEAVPPAGVRELQYQSGDLTLKAWVSDDPGDGKRRPAVVYLHGGHAFAAGDWTDAAPFVAAGYVLMMPMLRGENGNPGSYESYFGEVQDAIAAGRHVCELPYVDQDRVFVAGHSVGGVLTVLVAMMPSDFKAAAALSGYLDMASWAEWEDPSRIAFDRTNPDEIRLRNPMGFVKSLQIPVVLYAERGGMDEINQQFLRLATDAGKPCTMKVVDGDHMSMVQPAVQDAIAWFRNR